MASEESKTPDGKKGISRRKFIAVTATGVVVGAAAGVAAGYLGAPKTTSTETNTLIQTVTTPTTQTSTTTQTVIQAPTPLTFSVNGVSYSFNIGSGNSDVREYETLADTLRETLGLIGTKQACKEGDCGACTVIADGNPILSCLTLTAECGGRNITTIEGLPNAETGALHPIQQAFINNFGFQCGYCTPGMIMSAKALLDKNPTANEAQIRTAISGNMCRCTGYVGVVNSILAAEQALASGSSTTSVSSEEPIGGT